MIPQAYIQAWREHAPWPNPAQVEQDLIICRALCDLFNAPALAGKIAFRGGTAIHKLSTASSATRCPRLRWPSSLNSAIYQRTQLLKTKHAAIRKANAALLPATLECVFQSEATQ